MTVLTPNIKPAPWSVQSAEPLYPFWEKSGNPRSLDGTSGTLGAGALWGTGHRGHCIITTGATNSYVEFPVWDGTTEVTLEWYGRFRSAAGSVGQMAAADQAGNGFRVFQLRRAASGVVDFIPFSSNTPVSFSTTDTIGTDVVYVVATVSGGTARIYINGVQRASASCGNLDTDASRFALGGRFNSVASTISEPGDAEHYYFARHDRDRGAGWVAKRYRDVFEPIRPRFPVVGFAPAAGPAPDIIPGGLQALGRGFSGHYIGRTGGALE